MDLQQLTKSNYERNMQDSACMSVRSLRKTQGVFQAPIKPKNEEHNTPEYKHNLFDTIKK